MFYSVGILRTSSLGGSISNDTERTALRRQGDDPGHTEVLQQRAGSQNIKNWLLIEENKISQVKKFSTLLCTGRCKSLGSLKSFLWYASQLPGASILCFHILSSSGLTVGSGCSLMADRWQILFFLIYFRFSGSHRWAVITDDWHPCLLIWWEIFLFSNLIWK